MTELIVALDVSTLDEADAVMADVGDAATFYKVGFQLFMAHGRAAVARVKARGARVFLDLKLHDIPQTVHNAVKEAASMGVDAVSIHASGGQDMLLRASEVPGRPALWAVTVLTSLVDQDLAVLGGRATGALVTDLAALAHRCGIDGVVCSGQELQDLRPRFPSLQYVVPGIRMPTDEVGDQRRTITPAQAHERGATHAVVGRPITRAPLRRQAALDVAAQLRGGHVTKV